MAGFGTHMKKRPFPDEDEREEAADAEYEDAPKRPPAGKSMDGDVGDEDEEDTGGDDTDAPERPEREETDAPAPGESDDEGGEPTRAGADVDTEATPEEQALYDRFVKNGMRMIYPPPDDPQYDEKLGAVLKSLEGDGNPVEGIAITLAPIVLRLVESAKKAGSVLPPSVVMHGTGELLEQLAELSKESGGHEYSDEELQQVMKVFLEAGTKQSEQTQPAPQGRGIGAPMQRGAAEMAA